MIKLEAVHIEEVRGIRNLDIEFGQKSFAISGPNGSGKSGVIDAIEFALTGQIGRLTGRGTKALTLSEHGPHVDKTKFPDAAFVTLKVYLPTLKKTATITRKVASPKKPTIVPTDADVLAAFGDAGATVHEIMAITGHKTLQEVERYTKAADQKRLAKKAAAMLRKPKEERAEGAEEERNSGNAASSRRATR